MTERQTFALGVAIRLLGSRNAPLAARAFFEALSLDIDAVLEDWMKETAMDPEDPGQRIEAVGEMAIEYAEYTGHLGGKEPGWLKEAKPE